MTKDRQKILITGAGQRIGLYLCESLLRDGFQPIITYRKSRQLIENLEQKGVIAIQADFSSQKGVSDFIDTLKTHTSNLRAIIHNASTWSKDESIVDNPEEFSALMNVHVFAPYWINTQCQTLLKANDGLADIISLTDFTVTKGSEKHAAYIASKAALESLTLSFAKKFAPKIKVNSIAPALIMFNEGDDEDYKKDRLDRSALKIEPGPKVVYEAVKYLMDNSYTTGTVVPLNGGRNLI